MVVERLKLRKPGTAADGRQPGDAGIEEEERPISVLCPPSKAVIACKEPYPYT